MKRLFHFLGLIAVLLLFCPNLQGRGIHRIPKVRVPQTRFRIKEYLPRHPISIIDFTTRDVTYLHTEHVDVDFPKAISESKPLWERVDIAPHPEVVPEVHLSNYQQLISEIMEPQDVRPEEQPHFEPGVLTIPGSHHIQMVVPQKGHTPDLGGEFEGRMEQILRDVIDGLDESIEFDFTQEYDLNFVMVTSGRHENKFDIAA